MYFNQICVLLIVLFNSLKFAYTTTKLTTNFYTAGVIEFSPELNDKLIASVNVKNNLKAYLILIDEAKLKNVDILVFPEATLNYYGIATRQELVDNGIELPDPIDKIAPCDYPNQYNENLEALSKHAKATRMYILINLVEKSNCQIKETQCANDGFNLYNTNIVFNRNGEIISKYRKHNLFVEPFMNRTEVANIVTFTTDFGVTFGHFICFDLLFEAPALKLVQSGIKHILYPSMWFSDLPFLTSTQIQQSWAYDNNVNLLSAGASNPNVGSTGSGIFLGKSGPKAIILSATPIRKLLVAQVPVTTNDKLNENVQIDINTKAEDMDPINISELGLEYTEGLIDKPKRLCRGDICCEFDMQYKLLDIPYGKIGYTYRLTIFSGTRIYGRTLLGGEMYCAIIACRVNSNNECGKHFKNNKNLMHSVEFEKITIKAFVRFTPDNSDYMILPNTLDTSLMPLNVNKFNYEKSSKFELHGKTYQNITIKSTKKIDNLFTFGIFSRNFNLDQEIPMKRSIFGFLVNSAIKSNSLIIILMILSGLLAYNYLIHTN